MMHHPHFFCTWRMCCRLLTLTVLCLSLFETSALGLQRIKDQNVYIGLGAGAYDFGGRLNGSAILEDPDSDAQLYLGRLERANGMSILLGTLLNRWLGIEYDFSQLSKRASHQKLPITSQSRLILHRAGLRFRIPVTKFFKINLRAQVVYQEFRYTRFGSAGPNRFEEATLSGNGGAGGVSLETLSERGHLGVELKNRLDPNRMEKCQNSANLPGSGSRRTSH